MGIGEPARSTLREALRVRQVTPRATYNSWNPQGRIGYFMSGKQSTTLAHRLHVYGGFPMSNWQTRKGNG
ncbi:hypothetical protein CEN49_21685 [Fischerella thermalis CCMEE 5273]|jgi:hypothetical protein|nr:hypothetical protein CEN49_21685 [Fischerella thermalis CCMEE 5273]